MKFRFLGTAAAEGMPAVFCRCEACEKARALKGKNIRSRAQAIVNGELLLDFSSDTYWHAVQNGLYLDEVKYIYFTHSHMDHCSCVDLQLRGKPFAHGMKEPVVTLYGNEAVKAQFDIVCEGEGMFPSARSGIVFQAIKAFETVKSGDYEVTALPARHAPQENAYVYVISRRGKTVFYCLDTGWLLDETFAYLQEKKYRFDMIALDCTSVDNPSADTAGHMNLQQNARVVEKLRAFGCVDERTKIFVTHFSHNGNPLHERVEALCEPYGFAVAYDGLEVEL
ncbi:MAG: hypothetical protein IJ514_05345 [Clostridia bacterium]|nr:hypothetical protein [Clostridia bacterium]